MLVTCLLFSVPNLFLVPNTPATKSSDFLMFGKLVYKHVSAAFPLNNTAKNTRPSSESILDSTKNAGFFEDLQKLFRLSEEE